MPYYKFVVKMIYRTISYFLQIQVATGGFDDAQYVEDVKNGAFGKTRKKRYKRKSRNYIK